MTHLILIAIGPIQDFIKQARRTRDLWFGSHLLSELSRSVARSLASKSNAELIFPAIKSGSADLDCCEQPVRKDGTTPLNVANKILAVVPGDPREAAKDARAELYDQWKKIAAKAKGRANGLIAPDTDKIWDEQIEQVLEFIAVWAPLDGKSYAEVRDGLEADLGARKNLRDFEPWQNARLKAPKSSLDGARDSVLLPRDKREKNKVRRFRIGDNEQLDAVGVVKRCGGEPEQFVPISNVALARWVTTAEKRAGPELERLKDAIQKFNSGPESTSLPKIDRKLDYVKPFHWDAQLFLEDRWKSVLEEAGVSDWRDWAEKNIRPVLKKMPTPNPYVACIVADGDRMGVALDGLKERGQHQRFSEHLAEFAKEARKVVEEKCAGSLVFAGGDDVVAFVSMGDAIRCAEGLRQEFLVHMKKAFPKMAEKDLPTLSVGVGIGHLLENMGDLLDLGRKAEKLAKDGLNGQEGRNALAVILDKRSGGQHRWFAKWSGVRLAGKTAKDEGEQRAPLDQFNKDRAALKNLSTKKIYEIAAIPRFFKERLKGAAPVRDDKNSIDVIWLEAGRALQRNDTPMTREEASFEVGESATASIQQWSGRMMIVRHIDRAMRPLEEK